MLLVGWSTKETRSYQTHREVDIAMIPDPISISHNLYYILPPALPQILLSSKGTVKKMLQYQCFQGHRNQGKTICSPLMVYQDACSPRLTSIELTKLELLPYIFSMESGPSSGTNKHLINRGFAYRPQFGYLDFKYMISPMPLPILYKCSFSRTERGRFIVEISPGQTNGTSSSPSCFAN